MTVSSCDWYKPPNRTLIMNKLIITTLLLTNPLALAELTEEFLLRLQQVSAIIQQDDPDFYQKARVFAETSQARYILVNTIITAIEAYEISAFDAANLLNIAKCSLECAYIELNRIRLGLGD